MKKIIFSLGILFLSLLFVQKCLAVETLFFDSTDHYLGACQLTNKSEWQLNQKEMVTKFEVWYSWNQGETELPVKLYKDGQLFAEFVTTRGDCDPYQRQWCNADYMINKEFPVGKYSTEISDSRQCLKPGGTGAIRLYKDDDSSTVVPTIAITQTPTMETEPTTIQSKSVISVCGCNQTKIITSAVITSGVTSLLMWLILKKK